MVNDLDRLNRGPRVLSVCRLLWNGGVQRVAIAQVEALRQFGVSCDLLFLRATAEVDYTLPKGTLILTGPRGSTSGISGRISRLITGFYAGHRGQEATVDLDLLWRARHMLGPYDVIIFNDQYAAALGVYLRLRLRIPYIMMFHEFYPEVSNKVSRRVLFPIARLYDLFALLVAPAVVTISDRNLRRLKSIIPGKSYLARDGVNIAPERPSVQMRDRHQVMSISVWDIGRHPEVYISLARALPQFKFTLVGIWADSDLLKSVKELAATVPNLRITGRVSEEDRESLLKSSLIYLRLGYDEAGPGMGGLEAMAIGSIVVTNRQLGISEIITDRVDGVIIPDAEIPTIVRAFEYLDGLSEKQLERISAAAYERTRGLSWSEHARILRGVIDELTRQKDRAHV